MFLELRNLWTRRQPASAALLTTILAASVAGGCSADFDRLSASLRGEDSPRTNAGYRSDHGWNGDDLRAPSRDAPRSSFAPGDYTQAERGNYRDTRGAPPDYEYGARTVSFTETASINRGSLDAPNDPASRDLFPERAAGAAPANDPVRVADALPRGPDIYDTGRGYNGGGYDRGYSRNGGQVTVVPGDTLYSISRRNGVSVDDLKQANGLTNTIIVPGQRLVIPSAGSRYVERSDQRDYLSPPPVADPGRVPPLTPGGNTYTVREGDSLYAIARTHGVSVTELQSWNGIHDARSLRPGQVLSLGPDGGNPSPSAFGSLPEREPVPERRGFAHRTTRTETIRDTQEFAATPRSEPSADSREFAAPALTESQPADLPPILNARQETPQAQASRNDASGSGERVAALQSEPQPSTDAKPMFRWPVIGRVIAGFGPRPDGSHNDGIDIAVPMGTEIMAAADGVVAYAGSELKGYGNLVLIRHDNGWVSAYAHADKLLVKRGDNVRRGQTIATAGKTGAVDRPMVHFELREGAKPVDPQQLLGS